MSTKATGWMTGVQVPAGAINDGIFFSSPPHPLRLWGSPNFLSNQ